MIKKFPNLYSLQETLTQLKLHSVKNQRYEEAAILRDVELKLEQLFQ